MKMTYCPFCRTDIRDDLHRCPHCTTWLTNSHRPGAVTFGTIVGAVIVAQLAAGVVLIFLLAIFGNAFA